MERPSAERHEGDEGSRTTALLRAYHLKGDITARQRLVEVYLPLVESFARRYSRSSDDYDDLYQALKEARKLVAYEKKLLDHNQAVLSKQSAA